MSASSEALERLLAIMSQLRHPETGCSWDCQQTFSSLVPHMIEESYEVADAIEREDFTDLPEELGDLLYQIVFYAEMGKEKQLFDFKTICDAISDKLIRRHPHVFTDDRQTDKKRWEATKQDERQAKNKHSILDDIPRTFPALMRADKIQKRCASVGFDWDNLASVVDKVYEEIDEVMFEAKQAVIDEDKLEEEVGDLLFATVNLSRHLGKKAETALQNANIKFERRFRQVENMLKLSGKSFDQTSLDEIDEIWNAVKKQEKTTKNK